MLRALTLLALLAPPAPTAPRAGETVQVGGTLTLESNGSGGFLYHDADAGFSAEIAADGSVRFRDGKLGPSKGKVSVVGFDIVPSGKGKREVPPQKPFREDIVPHGPYKAPPILGTAGGKIGGFSDAMQASRKYKAKQRFLDLTESLRAELAAKARDKATRVALFELSHELITMWRDPKLPLSIRKERLFAAWDDCSEPDEDEDAEQHPGARARRQIEKFVRVHAKRGSDDGFTDADLRGLNERRRSRARFAPYGP